MWKLCLVVSTLFFLLTALHCLNLTSTPKYTTLFQCFLLIWNKLCWYTCEKWRWIGGEAPGFNASVSWSGVRKHVQPNHTLPSLLCYEYFNYNLTFIYKSKHNLKSNFQAISSLWMVLSLSFVHLQLNAFSFISTKAQVVHFPCMKPSTEFN